MCWYISSLYLELYSSLFYIVRKPQTMSISFLFISYVFPPVLLIVIGPQVGYTFNVSKPLQFSGFNEANNFFFLYQLLRLNVPACYLLQFSWIGPNKIRVSKTLGCRISSFFKVQISYAYVTIAVLIARDYL